MHGRDSPEDLVASLRRVREEQPEIWEAIKAHAPSRRYRLIIELLVEDNKSVVVVGYHIAKGFATSDEEPEVARDRKWWQLMIFDVLSFFRVVAELLKKPS